MKAFPDLIFSASDLPFRERTAHWRNLAQEANYSAPRLAERCQMSLRQLERLFKLEIGFTPKEWLKWQRLEAALVRLQGSESIKEIAHSLHYCQVSHFCRDFKLHFEMTPSESRRLGRAAPERLLALMSPTRGAFRESRSKTDEFRESRSKSEGPGKMEPLFPGDGAARWGGQAKSKSSRSGQIIDAQ